MSISENKVEAINVVLAKTQEGIDSFFEGDQTEEMLLLSTANGSLISLNHSFGTGVGGEQNVVLKFVDSGGTTLMSMFGTNISSMAKRARIGSKQHLFLITYGSGSNKKKWSIPSYHYIYKLDYDILADGLEITTVTLTPSLSVHESGLPTKPPLSRKTRLLEREIIGEVSEAGLVTLVSEDKMVSAFLRLIGRTAVKAFGMPAVMRFPKDLIRHYLFKSLFNRMISGAGKMAYSVGELAGLAAISKKSWSESRGHTRSFDINIDNSADYKVRWGRDGGDIEIDNWETSEKLNTLLTLLGITGFTLTKMKSFDSFRAAAELTGEGLLTKAILSPVLGAMGAASKKVEDQSPYLTDSVDMDIATTEMEEVPEESNDKTYLTLSFSLNYNTRATSFRAVMGELFQYLRMISGKKLDFTLFLQNEGPALQKLAEDGHIPTSKSNAPVVIFGELIEIINSLGEGAGQIPYRQYETGGDYTYNRTRTEPLFLSTSKNILGVEVNSKMPAVEFFTNNIFYSDTAANGTESEYIEFITDYLKKETERFTTTEDNPFSEDVLEYYDYKKAAKALWGRLKTNDPKAFTDTILTSESKYGGILTYLYWYYKYAALGTVFTTIKATPHFNYSSNILLGQDAFVSVLRNPSPNDHVMDKYLRNLGLPPQQDNFVSGRYRIQGFSHSITNSVAMSTFHLQKVSLNEISEPTPKDLAPLPPVNMETGVSDLGPKRQEDSLLDMYDQGLGSEYGNYKA